MKKIKNERHQQRRNSLEMKVKVEKKAKIRIFKYNKQQYDFDHNKKVINDIIFNETSKLVTKFKDFLIYGDESDFLIRYMCYSNIDYITNQKLKKG